MVDRATSQADNVVAPRRGQIYVVSVDGTSRPYNLSSINIGVAYRTDKDNDCIFVDLYNDGSNTIYLQFAPATHADTDDTVTNAAGTNPLVSVGTEPFPLAAGAFKSRRIQRNVDKFLILKCAGASTSTLRFCASSQPDPAALR